jgi:undecaprenyl-phosphate 4-deoxy-4-formamido-L-arabinose transferase
VVVRKLVDSSIEMGWSSIIASIFFIGGLILVMLGLIGEYIGRIYISLNNAPQYTIREIVRRED